MVGSACSACGADQWQRFARSVRSGQQVERCRGCRLVRLADAPEPLRIQPATELGADEFAAWVDLKRAGTGERSWHGALHRIDRLLPATPGRSRTVYDVGAGDAAFLALAREAGFEPRGNDVSEGAVLLARARHQVTVDLGDLSVLDLRPGGYDVATLWCVLAHVPDPELLLNDAAALVRPGGVLFLQTPRWSLMDEAALALHRLSRGRASRLLDRRVATHHRTLHTERSIVRALARAGLEPVEVRPTARYSLQTWSYLHSLGVPRPVAERLGRLLDVLLDRGLFFRITLDVYARRTGAAPHGVEAVSARSRRPRRPAPSGPGPGRGTAS